VLSAIPSGAFNIMSTTTWIILGVIVLLIAWMIIIYNGLVAMRQRVSQSFADVDVQLKQRHDLVPNLVETVKGYAAHEKDTLDAVVEARAKATQVTVTPETLNDPEAFKKFQDSQSGLTSALSRLLAVVENYPDLKANQNFLALQAQLEGTENRIAVARRDYIQAVRDYNLTLRTFPSVLWATLWFRGNQPFANFTIEEDKLQVPKVDFGTKQGG
jgi:LemA protein